MRPSKGQCAVAGSNAWEWTRRADLSPCTVLQCPPAQCSVPSTVHSAPVSPQGSYSKEGRTPDRGYNASPAFLTMTFAFPLAYSCSWTCVSLNICFLLRPINFIHLSSITHEPVNGERDGGDSSSVILLPLRLIRLTLSDCWKECLN